MQVRVDRRRLGLARPLTRHGLGAAAAIAGAAAAAAFLAVAWFFATLTGNANPLTSNQGPDLVIPIGITAVGSVIVASRGRHPIGWLFLACGVIDAARAASGEYAIRGLTTASTLPYTDWAALFANWVLGFIFPCGALLLIVLLFPSGHLLSKRWLAVAGAAVLLTALTMVGLLLDPTPISVTPGVRSVRNPLGVSGFPLTANTVGWLWPVSLLLLFVSAASPVLRYRRSSGEERQQIKWFAFAVGLTVAGLLAALPLSFNSSQATVPFNLAAIAGIGVAIPVSCGVAILRYRLYGIDIVISRTLVYGSLAVFITGVYVAIAVGIGTLVGSGGRPNLGLSILATAVVAVGFQPLRGRLQRIANRLVYGTRATPYEVLSEFSRRAAETYSADDVLPRMARILREGTRAAAATVWLRSSGELRPAASSPEGSSSVQPMQLRASGLPEIPGVDLAVPVLSQGELLGALTITKRRGEPLTPIEQKLLDDLAHQAGLVLKNVGLTAELMQRVEELRASRQRLVTAQDEERRRLERNLHDGAQQHLVALKVKLGLAELLVQKDGEKTLAMLQQLKADTDEALQTLRDLARGIYPPILADQGLAAALDAQARKAMIPVWVESGQLPRYPADIEATVYFCVLEALQNVQKSAAASHAVVRLRSDGIAVRFEVEDDGQGFDMAMVPRGSGLTNMADRLDALGGRLDIESQPGRGTRIRGSLPVGDQAGMQTPAQRERPSMGSPH